MAIEKIIRRQGDDDALVGADRLRHAASFLSTTHQGTLRKIKQIVCAENSCVV
jgi:hypothetical protein